MIEGTALVDAMLGMDPEDNDQWTANDLPRMSHLETVLGDTSITRGDTLHVWNGNFNRDSLREYLDKLRSDAQADATVAEAENGPHVEAPDDNGNGDPGQDDVDRPDFGDLSDPASEEGGNMTPEAYAAYADVDKIVPYLGGVRALPGSYYAPNPNGEADWTALMGNDTARAAVAAMIDDGRVLKSQIPVDVQVLQDEATGRHSLQWKPLPLTSEEVDKALSNVAKACGSIGERAVEIPVGAVVTFSQEDGKYVAALNPHVSMYDACTSLVRWATSEADPDYVPEPEPEAFCMPDEWGGGEINPKAGPWSELTASTAADDGTEMWYEVWMEQRLYRVERALSMVPCKFPHLVSEGS